MTSFSDDDRGALVDNSVDYEVDPTHAFDSFMQVLTLKNTSTHILTLQH
jgi:hypothetical protein